MKTKAAERNIPLPVCLAECLKAAKETSTSEYVVSNRDGEPLSYTQFKRLWLMEQSLEHYRKLVKLTDEHYLYANSMQTAQRRIPIGGDGGNNKTWKELLVHYEKELENFKANLVLLEEKQNGKATAESVDIPAWASASVKILSGYPTVKLSEGASLFTNSFQFRSHGFYLSRKISKQGSALT